MQKGMQRVSKGGRISAKGVPSVVGTVAKVGTVARVARAIASLELGSVSVATITTTAPAPGILGWFGKMATTTSVVTLPVAGVVAGSLLVGYGIYKGIEMATKEG